MATVLESFALPAQTAGGATSTTLVGQVTTTEGSDNFLTRAQIVPPAGYATVTGVATNNATFTLRQLRAGSVLVANLATVTLASGTNLVAETPVSFTINATAAQQSGLQEGDVIDVTMVQNGTGLAVGAGLLVIVELS